MIERQGSSVTSGRPLVSKVRYDGNLKESIAHAVFLIGGVNRFIEEGDTVLLKPNYNTADPFPGSSDPEFVRAIIELLYQAGAGKVILGERTALLNSRRVLEQAGIVGAAEKVGAEVRVFGKDGWRVMLDGSGWRRVKVPGGRYLRTVSVAREALEIKRIVYAPLMKTHHAAGFTGAIKLSMGFVKPIPDQITFHMKYLQEKIAELMLVIKADLIIMDARKVFVTGGPSKGTLREPNLILASGDQVAIDVEGVKVLQSYPGSLQGTNAWELTQIRHAAELRLGPRNEQEYDVVTP